MVKAEEQDFVEILTESGLFNDIDLHFAGLVCRLAPGGKSYALFLAALLASYVVNERRQICLPLNDLPDDFSSWFISGSEIDAEAESFSRLSLLSWPEAWAVELAAHPAVAGPDEASLRGHLLVLDNGRLYLQRYWDYEQRLARMIRVRLQEPAVSPQLSGGNLSETASRFAGTCDNGGMNLQAAAVCAGLRNQFTIISGGPGCGKTAVIAAIAALWLKSLPEIRITLCAPTGRAQARLRQALLEESEFLELSDAVKDKLLSLKTATIHRLLGYRPGQGFHFHQDNHLPVDLLIVDEASMVPLTLMANLFTALPETCKVILLGDRNQLASVEAGAVLGDLSSAGAENLFSDAFMSDFARLTGSATSDIPSSVRSAAAVPTPERSLFQDHIVELEKSYRFAADGEIAELQRAIMAPAGITGKRLQEILAADSGGEVCLRYLSAVDVNYDNALFALLSSVKVEADGREVAFKNYVHASDIKTAFAIFAGFRFLSPVRRGPFGVENLNRIMARVVGGAGFARYSKGAPLMITRNAPQLDLYNGDIGLVWPDAVGRMMVWFERDDGSFVSFAPLQLPGHESAFATTVHKAQGSGYQRVVLLWPEGSRDLLTREMFYTGITRAAGKIEIWLPEKESLNSLAAACSRQVRRHSGLLQAML